MNTLTDIRNVAVNVTDQDAALRFWSFEPLDSDDHIV